MAERQRVVCRLYGELRGLIRRLPKSEQAGRLAEARVLMEAHRREADGGKQAELLKEVVSKISFLRVIVPRRPGDGSITGARYVYRDGELVEGAPATDGTRYVYDTRVPCAFVC